MKSRLNRDSIATHFIVFNVVIDPPSLRSFTDGISSLSPDDDELVKKLALLDLSAVIGYQILYDELISTVISIELCMFSK